MTHTTAITQCSDGEAVEKAEGTDAAASHLAAIQHSYEEARACIVDPSRSPSYPAQDCIDAYPETEAIDVDAVAPPVPQNATPPTESMSVAAKFLAERLVIEADGSQANGGAPASPLHTNASEGPGGSRRWWRAIRATFRDAVAPPTSDS